MGYKSSPESLGVVQACLPRPVCSAGLGHREPGRRWLQRGPELHVQGRTSQWASSLDGGDLPAWLLPRAGCHTETPLAGVGDPSGAG